MHIDRGHQGNPGSEFLGFCVTSFGGVTQLLVSYYFTDVNECLLEPAKGRRVPMLLCTRFFDGPFLLLS